MNKNEILEKSRAQNEDEGMVYIEDKGRRYGEIGFCSVFIIIMFFNLLTQQNNFVPYCMFFAYLSAQAYGKYRLMRTKAYKMTIILAAIASLLFLICYILEVLGIAA